MKTKNEIFNLIPKLINELNERLIERDELTRLMVLSIFSGNHMFLIGERGVAKSMTVELINDVIEETKFWQLQVGEDTKVEELFGEKKSDKEGAIQYTSKSSVLHSHFVVLDEMFKARGEVLNAMLELLVDGAYTSGDGNKRKTPLISAFGTSNEFPTETKMLPYVDRFLFWYEVERITSLENRKKYYAGDFNKNKITEKYFALDDLAVVKEESKNITIP
ncbi:MAG: AAA family ATPase, partial [Sulfurovum sp.]|nr:AAA family ATPase [Sulfurovaceae bacterium]